MIKPASLLIALALPSSCLALNLNFLKNSVLTEFSKEEANEFRGFVRSGLETIEDGTVTTWVSSHSDLKGKFKPDLTYNNNGITCRRSKFLIANKTKKEPFIFEICNGKQGWKIQDTPVKRFTKDDWEILEGSIQTALDHKDTGVPLSWINPKTKNSGSHVVLKAQNPNDATLCKHIAITIFDKDHNSLDGVYVFCKAETKEWERARHLEPF